MAMTLDWDPTQPPETEEELAWRASKIAGWRLRELADAKGVRVPRDFRHAKGWVGQLIERVLVTQTTGPAPDFEDLGIELKTLPIGDNGRPRETTYVCMVTLDERCMDETWETSRLFAKLRKVLWVPIQASPSIPIPDRMIGRAVLWSPDTEQEATLRRDWEQHMETIREGFVDELDATMGEALQIRPKAQNAKHKVMARGEDGAPMLTMPRGFYLRTLFTEMVLRM